MIPSNFGQIIGRLMREANVDSIGSLGPSVLTLPEPIAVPLPSTVRTNVIADHFREREDDTKPKIGLRERVSRCLERASAPLTAAEVAEVLDHPVGSIAATLSQMHEDDEVLRTKNDKGPLRYFVRQVAKAPTE
jgi:hypothetical protein